LPKFPQLDAFIKTKLDLIPQAKVKYLRGKMPVLKLLGENGEVLDELNIEKWNTDSIDEFLREKFRL